MQQNAIEMVVKGLKRNLVGSGSDAKILTISPMGIENPDILIENKEVITEINFTVNYAYKKE